MDKDTMKKLNIKPNTIYKIHPDQFELLKEVAIKVGKVKKGTMTPTSFFRYLNINTPRGKTVVMASFDEEGKLNACISLTSHVDEEMKRILWIDFAWKDPKAPKELNDTCMKYVERIAKDIKASVIRTQMARGVKAASKKYGFDYKTTILEKEVDRDDTKNSKQSEKVTAKNN